jgi:hypothetical protein
MEKTCSAISLLEVIIDLSKWVVDADSIFTLKMCK